MRIGVDLGGTKTEAVALAPSGDELARLRIATPHDGYDSVVRGIVDLVAALETQAGARATAIGIGIPGSLEVVWRDVVFPKPLKQDVFGSGVQNRLVNPM